MNYFPFLNVLLTLDCPVTTAGSTSSQVITSFEIFEGMNSRCFLTRFVSGWKDASSIMSEQLCSVALLDSMQIAQPSLFDMWSFTFSRSTTCRNTSCLACCACVHLAASALHDSSVSRANSCGDVITSNHSKFSWAKERLFGDQIHPVLRWCDLILQLLTDQLEHLQPAEPLDSLWLVDGFPAALKKTDWHMSMWVHPNKSR